MLKILCRLLETRLDNVVYRLGFARSRSDARQLVSHGLFNVNGRRVNIASYRVKMGDIIEPRKPAQFKDVVLCNSNLWIDADAKKMAGTSNICRHAKRLKSR